MKVKRSAERHHFFFLISLITVATTAKITHPIAPRIKIPYSVPVTVPGICPPCVYLSRAVERQRISVASRWGVDTMNVVRVSPEAVAA